MKCVLSGLVLVASLLASKMVWAVETSVDFPPGQSRGNFYCTFDGSGQVKYSTTNIKVRGFCAGDPGVSTPGQMQANSDDVKDYYFATDKKTAQAGTITITALDDNIHAIQCALGKGGRNPYPHGSHYCAR